MDAKDDALAIETSIIENVARLAPTEMEQYEAFKVLADKGQSVDDIAAVFGITANSVKRRLALGSLIPDVREAYSNQQIDAASRPSGNSMKTLCPSSNTRVGLHIGLSPLMT